ncbi:hypothetical protein ABMA27_008524 [Loxostege sticticalis]|uniref:CRAL-TRIO domain-containing protein n=1 Tax=Loxostege sticticalis TaxID=481309 RepID=A0ABR3HBV7_LOXSC
MESLKESKVLKYHPDTLQAIRKMYGLDQLVAMSDAIDILQEWIKKQDHFMKKDFDRDFLERLILHAKGSVERSKQRLDKMCTSKTLTPSFFTKLNVQELALQDIEDAPLPRLTQDHYRVYFLRNIGQKFDDEFSTNYHKRLICSMEYVSKNDYFVGVIMVLDFRKTNLVALLRNLSLVELQQECYGYRIKAIHMLSTSKLIETLVSAFKQFLSAKVGSRIHVHSTIKSLHEHIETDILPKEYGGNENSLSELHKQWLEVINSKEHMEYMNMMRAAGTNESFRRAEKYNEQILGMPGSFRALRVD